MAEGFSGRPVRRELSEENLSMDASPMSPESSEVTDVITQNIQTINIKNDDASTIQQQTGDSSLDITPYCDSMPDDLKVTYLDGVIIYHEDDRELAVCFQQRVVSIRCGDRFPDIVLSDDTISKSEPFFLALENLINRSTYIFILVTSKFTADDLSILIKDSCLMKIVYDTEKSWSVIPVWTEKEKRKRPMGLNAIKGIDFHNDRLFPDDSIRYLMKTRGHVKLRLRTEQEKRQKDWINSNRDKCKLESEDCKALPSNSGRSGFDIVTSSATNTGLFIDASSHQETVLESIAKAQIAQGVCQIIFPNGASSGSGTGFRVGDRYVMTAAHVVKSWPLQQNPESQINESVYAVFNCVRDTDRGNIDKIFYFDSIVYMDENFDVAIIALRIKKEMPPEFQFFSPPILGQRFFFIGHSRSDPMTTNTVTKHIPFNEENENYFKILNERCLKEYKLEYDTPQFPNVLNRDRILFQCGFTSGGSGSPGVYFNGSEIVVTTMLLCGYPRWFYAKPTRAWPEHDCVEQGVNFQALVNFMMSTRPDLCKEIFGNAKYIKIEDSMFDTVKSRVSSLGSHCASFINKWNNMI